MGHILKINQNDNVGIVIKKYNKENKLIINSYNYMANKNLQKGDRIALDNVKDGDLLIQYGVPFAISKGIMRGDVITNCNTEMIQDEKNRFLYSDSIHRDYLKSLMIKKIKANKTFKGFYRSDGQVGTRNYYIILPLSQCASDVAIKIAQYFLNKKYKGIDGIVSLPNTEGCGCTRHIQIERFLTVILGFISHPNVCRVLAVEMGCEQTNIKRIQEYVHSHMREDLLSKIDFISIEKIGGTQKAINEGCNIVEKEIKKIKNDVRKPAGIEKLIVGIECGGSDSLSGITANRLIGHVSDYVVDNKGSVIISEIPEMIGAEKSIVKRCINSQVAMKFKEKITWYEGMAEVLDESISDNLVPENISGGLINPSIKSLGAIIKGGTRPIVDVLEYAEKIHTNGLNIMQGPGNDIESVTGMTASGANIICFSTGRGTTTGAAITPVIKISSNEEVYKRLNDDMDFNGESILYAEDIEKYLDEFLDYILQVASGKYTKSELNDQHQFQVWTAGKLSV